MSDGLTIAIVCFPTLGGSGVVASEEAVGLAKLGHRIHLVSRAPPGRPLPTCDRLTFHRVEVPDYPLFEHPPYTVALASTLVELGRAHRLDVLHVHYAVPHAASAYLARQALGAEGPAVVVSLHGTDVMRVGAHPAYQSATRFTVAQAEGRVVPSAFLRDEARRRLSLGDDVPLEVIPNFVDAERFSPAERIDRGVFRPLFADEAGDGPVLFHVSNFRPVKRVPQTVEVLARVRRQLAARLVLVGDGPERAATEARVRALGLEGRVRFLGQRNDFVDLLRHADAFVLPSELESFGVAALEALSAGVPVFGYRVGGLPELVPSDVGRLVLPDDVDALAAAVVDVLKAPEQHRALREAARARVLAEYRHAPALQRYESYLRAVAARTRGSRR